MFPKLPMENNNILDKHIQPYIYHNYINNYCSVQDMHEKKSCEIQYKEVQCSEVKGGQKKRGRMKLLLMEILNYIL